MSHHHFHNLHLQRKGTFPLEESPLLPPSVTSKAQTQSNFHHVRSQLESQNSRLMDQRKNLINRSRTNRYQSSKGPDKESSKFDRYDVSSTQQVFNRGSQMQSKIQEIASLCRDDQQETQQEYRKITQAQRQIQNQLNSATFHGQVPALPLNGSNYDRETTFGPQRNNLPFNDLIKEDKSQLSSKNRSHAHNQKKQKHSQPPTKRSTTPTPNPKENNYRKSAIEDLKTDRLPQLQQKQQNFNNYMSMIEAIEAKAMQQIEYLRSDKINLMKKLNEEIRGHNQQKKIRILLQEQLKKMEGGAHIVEFIHKNIDLYDQQGQINPYSQKNGNTGTRNTTGNLTKAKVQHQNQKLQQKKQQNNINNHRQTPIDQYYQPYRQSSQTQSQKSHKSHLLMEIDSLNKTIQQYRLEIERLRRQGRDTEEAQALLQQGEIIRQQTMHLLNQQHNLFSDEGRYIEKLQNRIQQQKSAKLQFMNDLQSFKYKLSQLEEQNEKLRRNLGYGVEEAMKQMLPVSEQRRISFSRHNANDEQKVTKQNDRGETVTSRYYSLNNKGSFNSIRNTIEENNRNSENRNIFGDKKKSGEQRRSSVARMQQFEQLLGDIRKAAR